MCNSLVVMLTCQMRADESPLDENISLSGFDPQNLKLELDFLFVLVRKESAYQKRFVAQLWPQLPASDLSLKSEYKSTSSEDYCS